MRVEVKRSVKRAASKAKFLSGQLNAIVRFSGCGKVRLTKREAENEIRFPVIMAEGSHLFPSRTQKLSPHASKVLGWQRPGRIDHRRILLRAERSGCEALVLN